ncbi:hypothetical protein WA158_002306 [Blastocystis sp. Blastoise]
MVKERVLLDIDRYTRLKEDIVVYEELLKDVVSVFSSVLNLSIHSRASITRLIKHIGDDCIEQDSDLSSSVSESVGNKNNSEITNIDICSSDESSYNDMDLIRFTNNGPIFKISKSLLDSIPFSYISEQRSDELRTDDGTIFVGYDGNEASVYYVLDYLNGKDTDFSSFEYEEQLDILNLFEFCNLPTPVTLLDCRERRDRKIKKYEEGDEVDLIINGKKDTIVKAYLIKNEIWYSYINKNNHGYLNYNHTNSNLYIEKKYDYIDYIYEYINNGYIDIEEDKLTDINRKVFEDELYDLFGNKGIQEVHECLQTKPQFKDSIIINKEMDYQLQNWMGLGKKWKLLFRASEHNYSVAEFHKYCDNQGETVTIIKHKGHDNHINIFGGYTDQSWESKTYNCDKSPSKEFVFTLSNEHNIPPTQYLHNGKGRGIYCSSSYGPVFGGGTDIAIENNCHSSNNNAWVKASSFTFVDTPQKNSLFVNTNNMKSTNYFIVEDYEVWGRK